jgi:hypothetical protein
MTLENKANQQYRSQGERQVANLLQQLKMPFQYEPDIYLKEENKRYIWHPDFYLPEYHTVIEYLGITGNQTYNEMAERKQRVYTANNYHFIPIKPSQLSNGLQAYITKSIDSHLVSQLQRYQQTTKNSQHR